MTKTNKLISLLLLCLVLLGCGTKRKIMKAKAVAYEYPGEFSDVCAVLFPIIPTYVKGKDSIIERTITVKGDSIPCPKDNKGETVYVKCPDAKVIYRDVYRIDTITEESTSRLDTMQRKLSLVSNELIKEKEALTKYKERSNKLLFWAISLGILFLGSAFLLFKKW